MPYGRYLATRYFACKSKPTATSFYWHSMALFAESTLRTIHACSEEIKQRFRLEFPAFLQELSEFGKQGNAPACTAT